MQKKIQHTRQEIADILQGRSKKRLAIVGPCSIHDPIAAKEYASLLKKTSDQLSDELLIVMRVYFEKPRTSLGWKGFLSDPFLNGTPNIEVGLKQARQLLLEINAMGLPAATEFLDPLLSVFLHDLISWAAIGARTSASPLHRELASALPIPVGFKKFYRWKYQRSHRRG